MEDKKTQYQKKKEFILNLLQEQKDDRNIEKLKEIYDTWCQTYDEDVISVNLMSSVNFVTDYLESRTRDKNGRILDCGSGTGLVGVALAEKGYSNIDALDLSPESLEVARAKGVYKNLYCGDVMKEIVKLEDDSYSAIVSVGCLGPGHFTSEVFSEWARIVETGGFILATVRQEYLDEVQEHKDGKLEAAAQKLDSDGKWTFVGKIPYEEYGYGYPGLLLVFQAK